MSDDLFLFDVAVAYYRATGEFIPGLTFAKHDCLLTATATTSALVHAMRWIADGRNDLHSASRDWLSLADDGPVPDVCIAACASIPTTQPPLTAKEWAWAADTLTRHIGPDPVTVSARTVALNGGRQ